MENKFDKEIEDLGWEKMLALLDKEKPVVGIIPPQYIDQKLAINGSSRKRWALMALLFLSLAGCGVWSYHFFKIKPENQPAIALNNAVTIENNGQNLIQNNSPVIANGGRQVIENDTKKMTTSEEIKKGKNNNLTKWSNSKNANLEKQNMHNNFIDEKGNKIQGADNQLIVKNINPNSITQNLNFNKENKGVLIENKEQIIDKKLTNGSNASNAVISDDKTQNNEEKFFEKNATENTDKIEERLTFEALNSLVFEPLIDTVSSISERVSLIINLKENTSKILQKWQLGLTLGVNTEGVQSLDGYQMGLVLRKNLTQKWAISTGLNYRKSSIKSKGNVSFLAADKANASSSVTTPSSNFNLLKVVEVRLKDMQYLEMPIIFDHLVNRRLSVFGGVKMSYLLSKNWVKIDTTTANLYVITYGNVSQKVDKSASSFLDRASSYPINNSLDFAVLGGINYRISRHFDVSVRYDFGLKNILNRNNAAVYNRYMGLNLNCYF